MEYAIDYDGSNNRHDLGTTNATWDLAGGDDFTVEWICAWDIGATFPKYHNSILGSTASNLWGVMVYSSNKTTLVVNFRADDGTSASNNFTVDAVDDAAYRKYRLTMDRSGNGELFVDGTSKGTYSIAGLNGKAMTCYGLRLAGQYNGGGNDLQGQQIEFRWSRNLVNNSGGPGGG
jgi:hypothetical protein